jgi:UDP-N-acetylmuramate: L-alanyl-gamma-D-glutamyl-meso-diaminopimelate ligase
MKRLKNWQGATAVDRNSDLNYLPAKVRHIHLIGICGTGMAALAGMLKHSGYQVTGSDSAVYPPMSDLLREADILVKQGYGPQNLYPRPDLVVVGNVIRRENPEAVCMRELGIPHLSFPQVLSELYIKGKQSIVVCGTHGKTTTASLVAWILQFAGLDPGFMIGGMVKNFMKNYKVGQGVFFVAEGDEYDTAYFDKGPKFLHYRPHDVILTGIEFDHADIYRDLEHIKSAFVRLLKVMPKNGFLMACGEDHTVADVVHNYAGTVETYGLDGPHLNWSARSLETTSSGTRFEVQNEGRQIGNFWSSLQGRHNVLNMVAAVGLCYRLGVDMKTVGAALESFQGVKRRQEVRGERNGITIIDDFAHHPTEVRETVAAVRAAYPSRRLVAVFEPRTNTSRQKFFQETYISSFDGADFVTLREPPDPEKFPADNRFSSRQLALALEARGRRASAFDSTDELIDFLVDFGKPGDVFLIMSNGGFDNIHERLLDLL